jgi:two-component system, OmpR family, sensor kinase
MKEKFFPRALTSLFVRLFLCFFGVSALVLIATFYITQRAEMPDDILMDHASQISQDLLRAQNRGGVIALDQAHDRIRTTLRINAYLVSNGKNLGTRPIPPPAEERLGELRPAREARFRLGDGSRLLAMPVTLPPADPGHVLLFTHQQGDPVISRQSLLYWQLLALLCAAALVGWLVAHALTAPIRRMQVAVNRVASGDLDSRVGNSLNTGVGELVTLAGDIDHMAAQMQSMITARDRLFHHLSHEMRSPLARLRILLELLRDADDSGAARLQERLTKADHEIGRLDSMIDEILGLARFDGSKLPPMELLSMTDIVSECVDFSGVEAEAKSVRLRIELDKTDAADTISGNREMIVRAIDNLLRNAIRYTPANGEVSISLRREGVYILLSIADQGPGVPDKFLNTIFEPFFRLPIAKSQDEPWQEKGHGLGLTFVQLAAKLHGATVVASNKMSGGLFISIRFQRISQTGRSDLPNRETQAKG